ncbi:MAG: alcohol dehydrogenase, partial [Actinomycetota bacterium]
MSRLVFSRKPARFAAARLAGALMPGKGAAVGPLSLEPDETLPLPADDWVRLRPRLAGICGSD